MATRYSSQNLHVQGKEAEQAGEDLQAIQIYLRAIHNDPMDSLAYNRLMVLYRRRKEYQKEVMIIKAAIAAQISYARNVQQEWLKQNKKTARTAKALVKSLGLIDKKGSPVLESKQVSIWQRRLEILSKRLKHTASPQ